MALEPKDVEAQKVLISEKVSRYARETLNRYDMWSWQYLAEWIAAFLVEGTDRDVLMACAIGHSPKPGYAKPVEMPRDLHLAPLLWKGFQDSMARIDGYGGQGLSRLSSMLGMIPKLPTGWDDSPSTITLKAALRPGAVLVVAGGLGTGKSSWVTRLAEDFIAADPGNICLSNILVKSAPARMLYVTDDAGVVEQLAQPHTGALLILDDIGISLNRSFNPTANPQFQAASFLRLARKLDLAVAWVDQLAGYQGGPSSIPATVMALRTISVQCLKAGVIELVVYGPGGRIEYEGRVDRVPKPASDMRTKAVAAFTFRKGKVLELAKTLAGRDDLVAALMEYAQGQSRASTLGQPAPGSPSTAKLAGISQTKLARPDNPNRERQ